MGFAYYVTVWLTDNAMHLFLSYSASSTYGPDIHENLTQSDLARLAIPEPCFDSPAVCAGGEVQEVSSCAMCTCVSDQVDVANSVDVSRFGPLNSPLLRCSWGVP